MSKLTGKVALVTGGSRGIGAAIAKRLAREGADVALTYASAADKAQAAASAVEGLGRRSMALSADSASPSGVADAVERTVAGFGRIDILVNNAGIAIFKPLDDLTLEDFERTMAVNVRAVFLGAQAAARHMGDGGRIITIGSNMADRTPGPAGSLYAMSKSALIGLTKGMARDLGGRGITVNVVQPGPVDTDMNPADGPHAKDMQSYMAVSRHGRGAEIAGLVAYLAGEESAFVTGAALTIDGGFNA